MILRQDDQGQWSSYCLVIVQSPDDHPAIILLSFNYHPVIIPLSSSYHPVIIQLSSSYHPVIIQLSFSYYLVSLSYSMVTFCANSFRLTEACSCTILLSINNSRSGQEHAYTSGCTAHCPWKCKRIFFLSPRPKTFQTHHSLTKNSYVHWLKTSNPYNSFLPSS